MSTIQEYTEELQDLEAQKAAVLEATKQALAGTVLNLVETEKLLEAVTDSVNDAFHHITSPLEDELNTLEFEAINDQYAQDRSYWMAAE